MSYVGTQVNVNDPNVPEWYKMGLGSQADYDAIYGSGSNSSSASAAAAAPAPVTSTAFDSSTSFGAYLDANPAAQTASGYINALLGQYNLSSLTPMVNQLIQNGTTDTNLISQQIQATPEFKQAFPEIQARQAAGLTALSPADVINLRQGYQQVLANNGIDGSYLTASDMQDMATKDISPDELNTRITDTVSKINNDPTIAPQLQQLYGIGVTPGEAAAYFLDPDKTEDYLNQQVSAASIAARAQSAGFGQLTAGQATNLAGLVTDAQAVTGFGNLAQQKQLLDPTASENGTISNDTAIAAQFQNNAPAQQQLSTRLDERETDFKGGGNFADPNKNGITGAGAANT